MLNIKHTICPSCSVGCGINIISQDDVAVGTFPYKRHPINEGKNCLNGRNSIDYLEDKIEVPLNNQSESELDEVIDLISNELNEKSPEEVGLIISGKNTNEELEIIKKFADVYGSKIGFFGNNFPNFNGEIAKYDDVANASTLFIIGDIILDNPLLGRRIIHALKNNAKIYYLDKIENTITSINSSKSFKVDSISEFLDNVDNEIKSNLSDSSVIIFNKLDSLEDFEKIKTLANDSNSKILPVLDQCNTKGALNATDSLTKDQIKEFIKNIKVLMIFNDDILEYLDKDDLDKVEKIISFSPYANDTTKISNVVIPIKPWTEKSGSFTNTTGEIQSFNKSVESSNNVLSEIDVIEKLTEKLGLNL